MAGFDYTQYNYDALVEEITNKLKLKEGWDSNYESSTTRMLIELLASNADQLHYMLERRTQENFLSTARLPTSVKAMASSVGYLPTRKVSSQGTLELTLVDIDGVEILPTGSNKVFLPKNTQVTYSGSNYVTDDDIYVTSSTIYPISIEITEGLHTSLTFDTSDIESTIYNYDYVEIVDYEDVEENSFVIYTPTQTFLDVTKPIGDNIPISSLEFADPDDLVYDLRIMHDGLRIIFGDNTNGQKPEGELTVDYILSTGKETSVVATGYDFYFLTDLLEDDSGQGNFFRYSLTNSTSVDGGIDEETIEQVKKNAPNFTRTGSRAVTKFDYEYWVKKSSIGGIVDATSYSEQEVGYTVFNMNNVYVSYLKTDGLELTTTEKSEVTDYMDAYKSVTAHVVYIPANVIPLQIALQVKKADTVAASDSEFYDFIKTEMINYFEYVDGRLGSSVYNSILANYLLNLKITKDGISRTALEFVDINSKALKPFSTPITTQSQDSTMVLGTTGDLYRLVVDGVNFDYTQLVGDTTATQIAQGLDGVFVVDGTYTSQVVGDVLTITTKTDGVPFTITNEGSDHTDNIITEQTINIPYPSTLNTPTDTFLLAGSVEIIDSAGTVLYIDDGSGNIGVGGTIDYVTGELILRVLPTGDYTVRYSYSSTTSFIASKKDVFTYDLPKDSFYDVTEKFSTIELL